ncbi:unnamed protein product [Amoebophrya sp. A120]|nr:unnamed protein product [Amoebophrya sp. A120]|eukprot:GSA120T00015301001.1
MGSRRCKSKGRPWNPDRLTAWLMVSHFATLWLLLNLQQLQKECQRKRMMRLTRSMSFAFICLMLLFQTTGIPPAFGFRVELDESIEETRLVSRNGTPSVSAKAGEEELHANVGRRDHFSVMGKSPHRKQHILVRHQPARKHSLRDRHHAFRFVSGHPRIRPTRQRRGLLGRRAYGRAAIKSPSQKSLPFDVSATAVEDKFDRMFVLVLSARENFAQRKVMRATWLKPKPNWIKSEGSNAGSRRMWAQFLVGAQGCEIPIAERTAGDLAVGGYCTLRKEEHSGASRVSDRTSGLEGNSRTAEQEWLAQREKEKQLTASLQQEKNDYGDIALLPLVDVYHNSSLKMKLGLKWVTSQDFSEGLQWIVKVDDDTYLRPFALLRFLFPQMSDEFPTKGLDPKSEKILLGDLFPHSLVQRDRKTTKNSENNYPHTHYPPFPSGGSGEVFSWKFAKDVADHEAKLFNYACEDAALGIWAAEQLSGVRMVTTRPKGDDTQAWRWLINARRVESGESGDIDKACMDPEAIIIGDLTPEQIRACAENDARKGRVGPDGWCTDIQPARLATNPAVPMQQLRSFDRMQLMHDGPAGRMR